MKSIKSLSALLLGALSAAPVMAQQTYEEMEQLTVNEQVTTVITAQQHHPSETQGGCGCSCRW